MIVAKVTLLFASCCLVVGKLPSSCLTSLTTSYSVQCCQIQPFLEIAFKLRMGCDVPHHLDEGVRLEIRNSTDEEWQPIRYYTPTLSASDVSIVRVRSDNTTVEAEALTYTSVFRLELVEGNQILAIREYICDSSLLGSEVKVRWMQRYNETSVANVSTWSLDDVELIYWDGQYRHKIFSNNFDNSSTISDGDVYNVIAGNVTALPCDTTSSSLYFSEEANNKVTARRSVVITSSFSNSVEEAVTTIPANDGPCNAAQECDSGTNVCSIGSVHCETCYGYGYRLPINNTVGSCIDINECEEGGSQCAQICVNTPGSYHCECESGYVLRSDNISCSDIDECESPGHNCEDICTNTIGSYLCECSDGYRLSPDGFHCEDVNECADPSNACDQLCRNTNGSYECACQQGYLLAPDNRTCLDIDECAQNVCDQFCVNNIGSYLCECSEGYRLSFDGVHCEDVDECANPPNICDQLCRNTNGSYECACHQGYLLAQDNHTCLDINECAENVCEQICTNNNGSYSCSCTERFQLSSDGYTCIMIETPGCESSNCTQLCTNNNGSLQCSCMQGFTLLSDQATCHDIDECELAVCDQLCYNEPGSYSCDCRPGFTLSQDGHNCARNRPDLSMLAVGQLNELHSSGLPVTAVAQRLRDLVFGFIEAGLKADRNLSMLFSRTVDNVLSTVDTGGGKNGDAQAAVSSILSVLDSFALRVYDESEPELETEGFSLRVSNVSLGSDQTEGIAVGENQITLPPLGQQVKVASFFFKDLSGALPDNPLSTGSDNQTVSVISASICDDCNVFNLSEPVRYQLSVDSSDEDSEAMCFFYDLKLHNWSTNGCQANKNLSTSTVTVCECSHLTHFAILLSPGVNFTKEQVLELQIIGYVGVSISLFFLLLTVFTLSLLKSLWGMRNFIHINLCISLFVAQLIFVTAVDKSHDEILCQSIAVVLHYVFLVTFMWMLMEGIVLYVVLVKVFVKKQRLYMLFFTLFSYGAPLVYMALVIPLGFALKGPDNQPHYGYEACWLRYDTGFVWAFIAPVILIILVNIGFFIMAVYIMRKHTKRQTTSHLRSLVQWLKSSIVLVISMGIPWIVGVTIFQDLLISLAYVYTVFISLQGLIIFLLFVPLSKQVRESYKKWWRGKVSESDFLSKHFSTSDINRKSSFLGRLSSIKTSTFRLSHHDKSTLGSSHHDNNDIKLPDSPRENKESSLSPSPPPPYEKYVVESKHVVHIGNGVTESSQPNGSAICEQAEQSGGDDANEQSMIKEQLTDDSSNNNKTLEGTSL